MPNIILKIRIFDSHRKTLRYDSIIFQDLFMRNIRPEKGFIYYHTESGKLLKIATKEK